MARYLAAMLTYVKTITEDLLALMQKDNDLLIASFQEHMKPDKVASSDESLVPSIQCIASGFNPASGASYRDRCCSLPGPVKTE